jgi:hypothetical protein
LETISKVHLRLEPPRNSSLVDAGADLNAARQSRPDDAAWRGAKGWDQVAQFLVDHGAKLHVKDKRGHSPLDAAMGLLGNGGFDGNRRDVHESSVAVIRKLTGTPEAAGAH